MNLLNIDGEGGEGRGECPLPPSKNYLNLGILYHIYTTVYNVVVCAALTLMRMADDKRSLLSPVLPIVILELNVKKIHIIWVTFQTVLVNYVNKADTLQCTWLNAAFSKPKNLLTIMVSHGPVVVYKDYVYLPFGESGTASCKPFLRCNHCRIHLSSSTDLGRQLIH